MTSTATLRYQKQWRLERGRGLYRTVTADTVREHLRDLLRGEASLRGIAEVSGVPVSYTHLDVYKRQDLQWQAAVGATRLRSTRGASPSFSPATGLSRPLAR